MVQPWAHPWGLLGYHDRPLCTAGRLLSIKADDKISNAVTTDLECGLFGTGNISLLTLHSTITKQQRLYLRALSKWCLRNDMQQFTFLNTLNWYCVEHTCFRISSSDSANSNASKAVRSSYTHMLSCFVIFRFMVRGHSVQLQSFCFAVSA